LATQIDPPTPSTARDAAFFGLCVMLLLPSIWSPCSITGQDEYFLSFRTVFEMQERGEWLTPYVNGEVRLQKPPLLYWLMRCSYLLFGGNLFAARIWTVLAGATMALFVAKLGRRHQGNGYLAGIMIVSAAGVMIESRRAMFDLPVGCLCTIAVYYGATWHSSGRLRAAIVSAVALGLASMTKGPVALWFFAAPMLAALLTVRSRTPGRIWHWLVAAVVFCAIALPWPLWVQSTYPQFWEVMQTQAEHREFGWPPAKRLPALLGAVLGLAVPWSIAVIAAMWRGLRTKSSSGNAARYMIVWITIGLLPFVFMKAFERYMLALLCPMAVLASHWLETRSQKVQRAHLIIAATVTSIPVVVFALFAAWFGFSYLLPAFAVALLWLTMRMARSAQPKVLRTAGMCGAQLCLLIGFLYPSLGINQLPQDLPNDLATTQVRTFARPQPGMLSMRLQRSVQQMWGGEGLANRLANYHGYLFALESDSERIEAAARRRNLAIERVGSFHSFYSRKAWLKFYRQGIQWPDWREALTSRSPTKLQPRFVYYRLP
jgi:hypothetical protein